MTCEQAIEILPWYLNGTLEAREREEVRHHLDTCEACRRALAETRDAWRVFDQHLSPEALVALAWGETPEGIDPAVAERHLAGCSLCAADLELARTSRHLEEDARIALFPPKPAAAPARETRGDGESRTWRRAALAASLVGAVAVLGSFFFVQQTQREIKVAVNAQIIALYPTSEVVRGEEDGKTAQVDAPVAFTITPEAGSKADTYEAFEVEIRDPGGDVFFRSRDLLLWEDGDFSLNMISGFREPGRYEIQVFGLRDGRREARMGVYEVRVR